MGRAASIIIILCLLLAPAGALTISCLADSDNASTLTERVHDIGSVSYETHEAIDIWNDAQFASVAAEEGWSGDGSHELPYIIEGYQIQASSCVSIWEVESHFLIRNCDFSTTDNGFGVLLECAQNGRIESCTIHSVGCGIYVSYASGVVIYNNTLWDALTGIALEDSSECIIELNRLTNCSLEIYTGGPSTWLHNVTMNYVNEQQLGYFREQSNITIDASSCGQVILAHCQSVRVKNAVSYGIGVGITLGYSRSCVIEDCEMVENSVGLYADCSPETLVTGCHISYNDYAGVQLNRSAFCNVSGNAMYSNGYVGVVTMDSPVVMTSNTIFGSEMGVQLVNSSQSTLWNNEISYHQVGANVLWSSEVCIESNTFSHNSEYGLDLSEDCHDCQIYYNRLFENGAGNARDNGGPNTWDDGISRGNYWSDYAGVEVYIIPGSAESIDRYPMQLQYTSATISTTPVNTTGIEIPAIVSLSVTVGSVAIIIVFGCALARGRGPRSYQ